MSEGGDARDVPARVAVGAEDPTALEEIRERVMNVVGHALRTPMATLRGQAEVLARTDDEGRRRELTEGLVRSARRLERLLDDTLIAARLDTVLPVDDVEEVPIGPRARDVWSRLDAGAPRPGRALEVAGDVDAAARVNPAGLDRMLRHLLDNAVRYGRGGVTVRIEAGPDACRAVVVSTPRHAIGDDELVRAPELFYRGEGAVMDSTDRLGVGLTVVRRLARRAGGDVRLRRGAEGGGGTVEAVLKLPR